MRVIEVAHPTGAAAINGEAHRLNTNPDGREYDEDYDSENITAPTTEEVGDSGDEDYDEDYDPEAEAEAVAQALGNQIWAELGQTVAPTNEITGGDAAGEAAQVVEPSQTHLPQDSNVDTSLDPSEPPQNTAPSSGEIPARHPPHLQPNPFPRSSSPPTPDPMIETIKIMLSLALSDPHVHYALINTIVPGPVANGANLYTILNLSVVEGRVNPELAQPLSILISALASGSMMISAESSQHVSPPPPDPSSLKRKRESADEGQVWPAHPVYNPAVRSTHVSQSTKAQPSDELLARLQAACSDILRVLDPLLASDEPLHGSTIMSIQRQLHQVYAFVSTSPPPNAENGVASNTLQEIGGLIQVVGILGGVPIAQSIDGVTHTDTSPSVDPNRNGQSSRASNNTIGTAVHPCPTCPRVFNKLSSLRAHERTHTEGRPYRCEYAGCPASFARNHDLRRHEKSHERQMFRGCDRLFSRRDALRRHKTNEKAPDECREAPIDTSTVQHDGEPPRVTRVWQNHSEGVDWPRDSDIEDGEIPSDAIANARYIVGTIHATLQRHVTRGLHTEEPANPPDEQPPEPGPLPEQPPPEQPDSVAILPSDASTAAPQQDIATDDSQVTTTPPKEPLDLKATVALPGYGLDDEHANMLERAIAVAAQAAQAQAEAEAALYEEAYDEDGQDGEWNEEREDGHELGTEVESNKLVC
ncbi:Metallothionein expression activator [Ceratobasidium sp. 414]|nr:Metallothionein expression activator [Ceratobasidium sp. 414]